MAKFESSMEILLKLEFNNPKNALHKNPTERAYTFMGIYEQAWPNWEGWGEIHRAIDKYDTLAEASVDMYSTNSMILKVYGFYRREFYARMKLNHLKSQKQADEIFIFGVNVGCRKAVKIAQEIVGATADGIIGNKSIAKLDRFSDKKFSKLYDLEEKAYYKELIARNPAFKIYARGWKNRAEAV